MALQRILVGVDYSPCSNAALALAWSFAATSGGTVDVLHVFRPPDSVPAEFTIASDKGNRSLTTLLRERAQQDMQALLTQAKHAGISVGSALVEDGDPARRIVERAATGNYDLVVVGTHGRSGLDHVLLGSVAEKVVRHCSRPVLTVRRPA
jgi:nucleotide-binding universal stress UspA family protein